MDFSRTRTTQWNLLFHYISITLMLVSGVLLVPLYLQHIPLKLYGAWLATGNILVWLTAVDPGLSTILQQRVATAYGKSDIQSVGGFISGGLILSLIITLLLVLIGYALAGHIPVWLNLSDDIDHEILVQAFWVAVIGSSLQLFSFAVTSINQGLQSSLGIGLIYVVVHTLDILLILFLIGSGYGLMALAYSSLFRGIGMVIGNSGYLVWRIFREYISVSFSFGKVRELAGLIPFTFLAKAGSAVGNNFDSFITARFLGVEMVPILVLSRKAFDICSIIISRPAMAITPALSHLVGEGDIVKARHVLIRLVRMMTWLLVLVAGGLISLNSEFVTLWVGSHLYAGSDINMLLCLGMVLAIVTTSLSNLCVALGNIKGSSMATLVQSVMLIVLLVVGAKFGGLIGVVAAPLITMLLVGIWYFPGSFARLLELTREDIRSIGGEFLKGVSAAAVPLGALTLIHTRSLADFALQVIFFMAVYAVILGVLSSAFRAECCGIYQKVYRHSAG